MASPDKTELRGIMLARRRSLSSAEVAERSGQVIANLWQSGLLKPPRRVALYAAARGEVLTRPVFDRLREMGREVVLPRVRGRGPELDFFPVRDWAALALSRLGIPEPAANGAPVDPERFDLVVVPGVAFDARGGRVGYGMGCYDRVLARLRPDASSVGLGYDFQLVERIPSEEHDAPLVGVITESQVLLPGLRGSDSR